MNGFMLLLDDKVLKVDGPAKVNVATRLNKQNTKTRRLSPERLDRLFDRF